MSYDSRRGMTEKASRLTHVAGSLRRTFTEENHDSLSSGLAALMVQLSWLAPPRTLLERSAPSENAR